MSQPANRPGEVTHVDAPSAGAAPPRRARHQGSPPAVAVLAQAPLVLVLIGVAIGMVVVLGGSWRIGALVIGLAVAVGALERLLLPDRLAGLLQVRSRRFDVVALTALALGIAVLALVVPSGR